GETALRRAGDRPRIGCRVTVGQSDSRTVGPSYRWTSGAVAEALGTRSPGALAFETVSTDTRHLTPGTLFVALKGDRFDAHTFLKDAQARGATAAVVRRGTPHQAGLPFFEVDDTLVALGLLARARRRALPAGAPAHAHHRRRACRVRRGAP